MAPIATKLCQNNMIRDLGLYLWDHILLTLAGLASTCRRPLALKHGDRSPRNFAKTRFRRSPSIQFSAKKKNVEKMDANGTLMDANGTLMDANGTLMDANGTLMDANGR